MGARRHLKPGSGDRIFRRGVKSKYTYRQLQRAANQLSHVLRSYGVLRGDRVAIIMPQCFATAVAYIAVLQMGAVAMPLSMLFGPDALVFRLDDSEAVLALCDPSALECLEQVKSEAPLLRAILPMAPALWQDASAAAATVTTR